MKTLLRVNAGRGQRLSDMINGTGFPEIQITEQQKNRYYSEIKSTNNNANRQKGGGSFFRPSCKGVPLKTVWGKDQHDAKLHLISQDCVFDSLVPLV